MKNGIKMHIEMFPVVPSHYSRSETEIKYLNCDLNIKAMYRLYWCDENNVPKAKESAYRNVFVNEYNLGFHRPKKDQCRLCVAHAA